MGHHVTEEEYKSQVSAVWRATAWLSFITVVEVVAALAWMSYVDPSASKFLLNGFFIAASLLKAFFIVGEFMHVRYEFRALALTILTPAIFLIWFVIAFLWEGSAWKDNRQRWEVQIEEGWKDPAKIEKYMGDHGHHGGDDHGHDDKDHH
ncbi:MAG: cytochrome C oxidase subunit IV family protein [Chitinophagales bacterium]